LLETEIVSESNEVEPQPELERRTRRQFSGAEKKRLIEEMDALPRGEKGAWLRRNGLYAGQLANWRKALAETGERGLEPKTGGRKPADPRERELERLRRDKARLEQRLQSAEDLIELQKKLSGLLDRARNENER
jgi:transposase-like protein